MPINFAAFSGRSNVGFGTKTNEDYILINEKSFGDEALFACIADGSGSQGNVYRPASIAVNEVEKFLTRAYKNDPDLIKNNSKFFLKEAFHIANDVLISFKLGDEDRRANFATTLTAVFLEKNGKLTFAHAGNTRMYVLRGDQLLQMTKDHTEAQRLVDANAMGEEEYYSSVERLQLYNGIGMFSNPTVQVSHMKLRKNDVVILTSDGIHYSLRGDVFFEALIRTKTVDEAAEAIVQEALDLKFFPDNMSIIIIWYLGDEQEEQT